MLNEQPEGENLNFRVFVLCPYKPRKDDEDGKGYKPQQRNTATGEVYLKLCIKLSEILQLKTLLTGLKDCSVPYTKHPMILRSLDCSGLIKIHKEHKRRETEEEVSHQVLQGKVRSGNQKGNREASVERKANHVLCIASATETDC